MTQLLSHKVPFQTTSSFSVGMWDFIYTMHTMSILKLHLVLSFVLTWNQMTACNVTEFLLLIQLRINSAVCTFLHISVTFRWKFKVVSMLSKITVASEP